MIEVMACTNDYAVIVKPYGMLAEFDPSRPNVPTALAEVFGCGADEIFPVHRLDTTTEGLMLCARNRRSAAVLSSAVASGEVKKTYTAFLTADPDLPPAGELRDYLFFDRRQQKSFPVSREKKGAKEAILTYSLSEPFLWRDVFVTPAVITLKTGRTHQIRAQFSARRSPLIGDGKYGSRLNYKGPSLFSVSLSFPWQEKVLRFEREARFPY